jgi:hypothetical protein
MAGLRQCNKHIFEDGGHDPEFLHVTACASNLGLEPAQNILSRILPDADVQSISKRLNILHILILMRHVTKHIDRRAAQFKDASVEAGAQVGRRIFGNNPSILHETHTMTA